MKILHLIINSHGGGAERTVQELHHALLERGHESKIACIDPELFSGLRKLQPEYVLNTKRKKRLGRIIVSVIALNQILEDYAPDILQINCEAPEIVAALSRWQKYAKHLVVTEHNSTPWSHAPLLGVYIRRFSSIRKSRFTACANFKSSAYFDSTKSVVIENMLRSTTTLPRIKVQSSFRGIFLAQRLFAVKRIGPLFRIIGKIGNTIPLIVCGDGPELNKLRKIASTLKLNVDFKLQVPNPWDHYEDGFLYVSNSSREGNPLSVAEAVVCNAPILISGITTHKFAVTKSNQIFSNSLELEQRLSKLVNGELSLSDFQPEDHFREQFLISRSSKVIVEKWENFYASL